MAVLLSRLSGYMGHCLKMLKERHEIELLVIRRPPASEAPFEARQFDWMDRLYDRSTLSQKEILTLVEQFSPDGIFMSGWVDHGYLQVARALKKRQIPVVAGTDAQWNGSLRQRLGCLVAPWYLHTAIDALWVAGERQRQLADRLGYRGERRWSGVYACDWDRFAEVHQRRDPDSPAAFLYVGRYVAVKGLDVLVEAYRSYRVQVRDPWPLICVGAGEDKVLLGGQEGIIDKGFVQPDQLPEILGHAAAFVLPSRREPWGVVVQEAAAAGLPLICSDACGAAVHLLQDGYNGFLFETGNAEHLAKGMVRISNASREERLTLSRRSYLLSQQYTPQRWADTLVEGITSLYSTSSMIN